MANNSNQNKLFNTQRKQDERQIVLEKNITCKIISRNLKYCSEKVCNTEVHRIGLTCCPLFVSFPIALVVSLRSVRYLLSFCRPRQCHTDSGSPPHGPQSPMPVPQCQANKSVESDNLSKALTQFKDKDSRGHHIKTSCLILSRTDLNVNL